MNSSTATGWTSWSVTSGLIFFGVGLLITIFDCSADLQQMQAEFPNAPMYFGAETMALPGHGQVQFQYSSTEH